MIRLWSAMLDWTAAVAFGLFALSVVASTSFVYVSGFDIFWWMRGLIAPALQWWLIS